MCVGSTGVAGCTCMATPVPSCSVVNAARFACGFLLRIRSRKALLHWRHRKLTLSFRSLVTMVFRTRIVRSRSRCIWH